MEIKLEWKDDRKNESKEKGNKEADFKNVFAAVGFPIG